MNNKINNECLKKKSNFDIARLIGGDINYEALSIFINNIITIIIIINIYL